MSHLSKVTTKIKDQSILKKSLTDLQIPWDSTPGINDIYICGRDKLFNALFKWEENRYEFIADSSTWQEKNMLFSILEKIQQKYAYNIILTASREEGFNDIKQNISQDGSIKIVLEKWAE
uniref:hypothetical protein n=1 Tax=Rhodochorton tenue TaxID=173034 RepID=UPI002A7F2F42|nr:hypothetical protein UYM82_pgp199 [Rhodochorton tenue]WOK79396.1 hypothetical protein [Rhodochorton tenue]